MLLEKIDSELKNSMRSRDEVSVTVLRMIKSELKYKQIELGRDLKDEDVISVLGSAAKKRTEAIAEYEKGGRDDLVNSEKSELEIIRKFLPKQLSNEELAQLVHKAVSETGAKEMKDIGIVMKELMPKVVGRADGKEVNSLVRARLLAK